MIDARHRTVSAGRDTPPPAETRSRPQGTGPGSSSHGVVVEDVPPRRTHDFDDLMRALLAVLLAAAVVVSSMFLHGVTAGLESDAHTYAEAIDWLADVPASLLQQLTTTAIVTIVLAQLLAGRRWLVTACAAVALIAGYGAAWAVSAVITGANNLTLIAAMRSATTGTGPSSLLPDMYAGLAAFLTAAGPRRTRTSVKWGWNILYTVGVIMVMLSWNSASGVLVAFATGRLAGMLIRFAVGTESTGAWGDELVASLRGIGLDPVRLARRGGADGGPISLRATHAEADDDLTEGSRLYDMADADGTHYVVSVLDGQRHSAGYLRQVWQWLRFSGVAVRRDRSTRDATQHHLAMLLGLRNAGLPIPRIYGVADTDDSSILVFDSSCTERPADVSSLTADDMAAYMRYLGTANRHGYTHRHIGPATLASLKDGTALIAGWQNGDNASSAANKALDKIQLLVLAATLVGVDAAVDAARGVWGNKETASLAPFAQNVAVPASTRALPSWSKQLMGDLRARLGSLMPEDEAESAVPVTLARFSVKSFVMLALLVVALVVVVTQLKPDEVIAAVRNAQPVMAVVCVGLGVLSWVGSSLAFGAFIEPGGRAPLPIFMEQVATGFATVTMPAGIGPSVVNLQFLRRKGYRNTRATAIVSAVLAVYFGVYALMLLALGLITGRNMFSGMIPTNTLIIALGAAAAAVSAAMMIPPVRRLLAERLLPVVRSYTRQLWDVVCQPRALAVSAAGSLLQNVAMALAFWVSLLAFGHWTNPVETVFVFLLANALGSAVPTPGGLGGVEAALTLGFAAVGVPQGVALSATLLYRVALYWLRIPLGAAASRWLSGRNLI